MYTSVSEALTRKIALFQTATNVFNDLNGLWAHTQSQESAHVALDSENMRELVERNVLKRIVNYYTICGKTGETVLEQAMSDGLLVRENIKGLSTRTIINKAENFLSDLKRRSVFDDVFTYLHMG